GWAGGGLTRTVGGADAGQFAVVSTDCPAALPPNGSCAVGVQLEPTSVGAKSATLTVAASPGGSAASTLQGTGTATLLVQKVGAGTVTSKPTPTINCGPTCQATFSVPSVTLVAGADPGFPFTAWSDPGCPGAGDCAVALDAPSKTVTATFTPNAALAVAPTSQDFGGVTIGSSSAPIAFTVSNGGGLPSGTI